MPECAVQDDTLQFAVYDLTLLVPLVVLRGELSGVEMGKEKERHARIVRPYSSTSTG